MGFTVVIAYNPYKWSYGPLLITGFWAHFVRIRGIVVVFFWGVGGKFVGIGEFLLLQSVGGGGATFLCLSSIFEAASHGGRQGAIDALEIQISCLETHESKLLLVSNKATRRNKKNTNCDTSCGDSCLLYTHLLTEGADETVGISVTD